MATDSLSGVWEMARDHGPVWNRRDPSAQPSSGKDSRYKPMVKSERGQRKSDGVLREGSGSPMGS